MIQHILAIVILLQLAIIQPPVSNLPVIDACRINNTSINVMVLKKTTDPMFIKVTRTLNHKTTTLYHEYHAAGLDSFMFRDKQTNMSAKYTVQFIGQRPSRFSVTARRDCFTLHH